MADAFSFMTSTFKNINDFQTKNDDKKSNFYVENDEIISYSDNDGNGNGYTAETNYCDFTTFEELILSDANGNNQSDMSELMNYEDFEFNDNSSNGYNYEQAYINYSISDSFGNGSQQEEEDSNFNIES